MSAPEKPLDVDKKAIQRLMDAAQEQSKQAVENGSQWAVTYWDGYIRGLEHVLEMEDQ
jgi:hypothetical protein